MHLVKPSDLLRLGSSMPSTATTLGLVLAVTWGAGGTVNAAPAFPAGLQALTGQLARQYFYLLDEADQSAMRGLNRRLREVEARFKKAGTDEERAKEEAERAGAAVEVMAILEKNSHVIRVELKGGKAIPPAGGSISLPGDAGAVLLRVSSGEGPTRCITLDNDMSSNAGQGAVVRLDLGTAGTTWALVGLSNVPVKRSSLLLELRSTGGAVRFPLDVRAPELGRLKVTILSADAGQAAPAMVRLVWKTLGSERQPAGAVDFGTQFDNQGNASGSRPLRIPGYAGESYWCVAGPIDMQVPPGEWEISIRRGVEHVRMTDAFTVKPGGLVEKTYTPRRWVDMRKLGWYSGDDHVHARIINDQDARRVMAWVQAEDIHLANIVKMGDIDRTWFEQRGWGKEYRVNSGDTTLSPGQECPRTHEQLGHTLSMNAREMVRNTDRYYLYDEVADTVHAQGGLWGYAHVCSKAFHVERDMSMNVPRNKCDFVELMQFGSLGTEFYYDFLNLGLKVTASAGSDVPWGGSVGEVRIYACIGEKPFSADAWFDAVKRGRTFTTNGPMVEFRVDEALPGDEIAVKGERRLRVRARAWGDPEGTLPERLEAVRDGEVIKSAEAADAGTKELTLDFEVPAENGFWIAGRVQGRGGTAAHTTPVYVVREGLRFWKFEEVDALLAKRLASLAEIEKIVADAQQRNEAGEAATDRAIQQLALEGPDLLKRVAAARELYAELKMTAERERALRASR